MTLMCKFTYLRIITHNDDRERTLRALMEKEATNFVRIHVLGFQTYLLEEKKPNRFWRHLKQRIDFNREAILKALLLLNQHQKPTQAERLNQILEEALPPESEEEALLALFPEKITSFFADKKTEQLLFNEHQAEIAHVLEQMETGLLEDIEEDPLLSDLTKEIMITHPSPEEDLPSSSTRSFNQKKKSFVRQIPMTAKGDRINQDEGPSGHHSIQIHHLSPLEPERALLYQKQTAFVSRRINHLADAYFETQRAVHI